MLHIRPDVVCLDLMLSGLDGISVLESARSAGLRPTVLAVTRQDSAYVRSSLERLGVGYLMMKPCSVDAVANRLLDLCKASDEQRTVNLFYIDSVLFSLNFRAKLQGFQCIREALLVMMENPNLAITKEVYPVVAAKCQTKPNCVERVIRSSIEDAWKNRNDAIWQMYFNKGRNQKLMCPSNGNFLAEIAAHLVYQQENQSLYKDNHFQRKIGEA